MDNKGDKKLEWMYKSANSLVDREEYLLGRKVDKTLEEIHAEEKEKKFALPTPKNHVEHECIPPSIRDFNKIVQSEQVDLSAKLQEDPLVAIKKREEEARRQFLQNPVQLKKLQDALKAQQEKKKKKKHKKSKKDDSDSDIDCKIAQKLRLLKSNSLATDNLREFKDKSKNHTLDTILMHKFNALKDKLSEEDLQDILNGKTSSDSDQDKQKKKNKKKRNKTFSFEECSPEGRRDASQKKNKKSKRDSSEEWNEDSKKAKNKFEKGGHSSTDLPIDEKYENRKIIDKKKQEHEKSETRYKSRPRDKSSNQDRSVSRERYSSRERNQKRENNYGRKGSRNEQNRGNEDRDYKRCESSKYLQHKRYSKKEKSVGDEDYDLDKKITEKLKALRQEVEEQKTALKKVLGPEKPSHLSNQNSSDSESSSSDSPTDYDSDGEPKAKKVKSFGLVSSSGKKIALKRDTKQTKAAEPDKQPAKVAPVYKPSRDKVKKMTEEEKEARRREMMVNAIERDREREETVKQHREKIKREEEQFRNSEFNKEFVYQELRKSTKTTTVEERIKSNLNNIQRSSRHMDSNFSKR